MASEERRLLHQYKLDQAKELYLEGTPIYSIAGMLEIGQQGIIDYLKQSGLIKPKKRINFALSQDTIVKLYLEGRSPTGISFDLNISLLYINDVLTKRRILKNKYFYGGKTFMTYNEMHRYRCELKKQIIRQYKKGDLLGDIAAQCQVSLHIVKTLVSREKNGTGGR